MSLARLVHEAESGLLKVVHEASFYRLNMSPPKSYVEALTQYLRVWPYLEIGPLKW